MKTTSQFRIKITSVPPGEAPLWVREKWVGLSLPLAQAKSTPSSLLTAGVLAGPRNLLSSLIALVKGQLKREQGFIVSSNVAIELLSLSSPEAALWWRENTPHLLCDGQYFAFQKGTCHVQDIEPTS